MLRPRTALTLLAALIVSISGCGGGPGNAGTGASTTTTTGTGGLGSVDDIMGALPDSCAFECGSCAEPDTPFACPTVLPWAKLPHEPACGAWDGTYPAVTAGKCTASAPTSEAALPAGPITGGVVLPDGHRIRP